MFHEERLLGIITIDITQYFIYDNLHLHSPIKYSMAWIAVLDHLLLHHRLHLLDGVCLPPPAIVVCSLVPFKVMRRSARFCNILFRIVHGWLVYCRRR